MNYSLHLFVSWLAKVCNHVIELTSERKHAQRRQHQEWHHTKALIGEIMILHMLYILMHFFAFPFKTMA